MGERVWVRLVSKPHDEKNKKEKNKERVSGDNKAP